MGNQISIPWTRRSLFWGYVCAGMNISRAFSYWFAPPAATALSSRTFEQILSYDRWGAILFVLGVVVTLATWFQSARVAFGAHCLSVFCYAVFVYSSLGGVVEFDVNAGSLVLVSGWTGVDLLLVAGILHGERARTLGAIIRLEHAARGMSRAQWVEEGR